jgi:hypothetical protein
MPGERRGCGCWGIFFALVALLVLLLLVGIGVLLFNVTVKLNSLSSSTPVVLPAVAGGSQAYNEARQKFDHFFSDPNERNLTLSEAEVNALLANAPELGILNRGIVVELKENTAEIHCSVPVNLPFVSNKYLNYNFVVRPSLRGQDVELQVSQVDRDGKPLAERDLADFTSQVLPKIDHALSLANKYELDRSVRDVRVENSNLILTR